MLYRGVILSALSLVLGHLTSPLSQPSESERISSETLNTPFLLPTSSTIQDTEETDVDKLMGVCIFGSFPTATCMVKCFWKHKSTYCDEDSNCLCGAKITEGDEERSFKAPEDFTTLQPDFDTEGGVMGVCYFSLIPSPFCVFLCSVRGQSSICDENSRCQCEDRSLKELSIPTQSLDRFSDKVQESLNNESESDDDGSLTFYIFDLRDLFDREDTPIKDDPKDNCSSQDLWTVPHIVAMAILTLVAVLLALELALFFKRHYSQPCKQHLQTVLTAEVLEKGMTLEKHK